MRSAAAQARWIGLLAVVGGVAAERDAGRSCRRVAVERHAEVLELVDDLRRLAAHELDRVLVAEPVGALDGVVEVIVPVVFAHVAERGADAALRRHGVRAGREHLRTAPRPLRPARASCSDARMPAPPAPTTIASNFRTGSELLTSAPRTRESARAMRRTQRERRRSIPQARVSPRSP